MRTIGITGGVGAGKSTVLAFLEKKYDAYVIQADEVGHLVMEPGEECYEPVIRLFGKDVIKNDKTIDRKRVSDVVFGQPDMLEQLNGEGHMYATDVDPEESARTRKRLADLGFGEDILTIKLQNFCTIDEIAREAGGFDFLLADLGVSSMQIDNPKRGFSFKIDGSLRISR